MKFCILTLISVSLQISEAIASAVSVQEFRSVIQGEDHVPSKAMLTPQYGTFTGCSLGFLYSLPKINIDLAGGEQKKAGEIQLVSRLPQQSFYASGFSGGVSIHSGFQWPNGFYAGIALDWTPLSKEFGSIKQTYLEVYGVPAIPAPAVPAPGRAGDEDDDEGPQNANAGMAVADPPQEFITDPQSTTVKTNVNLSGSFALGGRIGYALGPVLFYTGASWINSRIDVTEITEREDRRRQENSLMSGRFNGVRATLGIALRLPYQFVAHLSGHYDYYGEINDQSPVAPGLAVDDQNYSCHKINVSGYRVMFALHYLMQN